MAELCFVEWIHEILAGDPFSHSTTHMVVSIGLKIGPAYILQLH